MKKIDFAERLLEVLKDPNGSCKLNITDAFVNAIFAAIQYQERDVLIKIMGILEGYANKSEVMRKFQQHNPKDPMADIMVELERVYKDEKNKEKPNRDWLKNVEMCLATIRGLANSERSEFEKVEISIRTQLANSQSATSQRSAPLHILHIELKKIRRNSLV